MYSKSKWTKEEDELLIKHFDNSTYKELSNIIKTKTIKSIAARANKIGLFKFKKNQLTEDEINFIKTNHQQLSITEMSRKLNVSIDRINVFMKNNNINRKIRKNYKWTEADDQFLRDNIKYGDASNIAKKLKISSSQVYRRLKQLNIEFHNYDYTSNLTTLTPEACYFWGYFFTDGCVDKWYGLRLKVNIDDGKCIEHTMDKIANWNKYSYKAGRTSKKDIIIYRLANKKFYQNYIIPWELENKSYYLSDNFYNFIDQNDTTKKLFLRGIIDGDGCIGKACTITITSRIDFNWHSLTRLIPTNIQYKIRLYTNQYTNHQSSILSFNTVNTRKLLTYIYQPNFYDEIGLKRKQKRAHHHLAHSTPINESY